MKIDDYAILRIGVMIKACAEFANLMADIVDEEIGRQQAKSNEKMALIVMKHRVRMLMGQLQSLGTSHDYIVGEKISKQGENNDHIAGEHMAKP